MWSCPPCSVHPQVPALPTEAGRPRASGTESPALPLVSLGPSIWWSLDFSKPQPPLLSIRAGGNHVPLTDLREE